MKVKYKLIAASLLVAAGVCWFAFVLSEQQTEEERKADYFAAVTRLNDQLRKELNGYRNANGRYPQNLSELSVSSPTGEPDILDYFSYITGANYYILTWDVQWGEEPPLSHKEHATKGKVIFVEDYVEGQLSLRVEYHDGYARPGSRAEKRYRSGRLVSVTEYRNGREVSEEKLPGPQ